MTKDEIMALADAYAASVVAHGADKRDEARAALEAALDVALEILKEDWCADVVERAEQVLKEVRK